MKTDALDTARTLVEALPYIQKFRGQTVVIGYCASAVPQGQALSQFCEDILLLKYVGIEPVVVHSTVLPQNLFISELNGKGGKAVGVSGEDANLLLLSETRSAADSKQIEVAGVEARLLEILVGNGYIPVVSACGVTKRGATHELTPEQAASALGSALNATKLILLCDAEGVIVNSKLLQFLELKDAEELCELSELVSFQSLLKAGIRAIKKKVKSVHYLSALSEHAVLLEIFTSRGIGTMLAHTKSS